MIFNRPLLILVCLIFSLNTFAEGESTTEKAERLATPADQKPLVTRRAKLTEEQVTNQLQYMAVEGWKRIEKQFNERGSFPAFGLTLTPQGEFNAVHVNTGGQKIKSEAKLAALVQILEQVAAGRTVWAVGMMYVTSVKREDGTIEKRVAVVAEHIAGWAKAWSYPYVADEGGVKLGKSNVVDMEPVYFK